MFGHCSRWHRDVCQDFGIALESLGLPIRRARPTEQEKRQGVLANFPKSASRSATLNRVCVVVFARGDPPDDDLSNADDVARETCRKDDVVVVAVETSACWERRSDHRATRCEEQSSVLLLLLSWTAAKAACVLFSLLHTCSQVGLKGWTSAERAPAKGVSTRHVNTSIFCHNCAQC